MSPMEIFQTMTSDGYHIAALVMDIVVIGVILWQAIIHAKKGFIRSIVDLIGFMVSVIVAVKFCSQLADFLQAQFGFKDILKDAFLKFLQTNELFNVSLTEEGLKAAFASYGLPEFFVQPIVDAFDELVAAGYETIAEGVAPILAGYAISIISAVLIFIVVFIVMKLICALITKIFDSIKFLGFLNRFLGFVLGLVIGLFIVNAGLSVVMMLPFEQISQVMNLTYVSTFLLNNNLLLMIIAGLNAIVPEIPGVTTIPEIPDPEITEIICTL